MKQEYCCWCDKPVRVQDNFNPRKQSAVCSVGCRDAEAMFRQQYSDEEINRRAHYRALTQGGDDETQVQNNKEPDAEAEAPPLDNQTNKNVVETLVQGAMQCTSLIYVVSPNMLL